MRPWNRSATRQGPVIDTLHLLVLRADGASARPPAKPVSGHGAE
jgi:hypothetical protein